MLRCQFLCHVLKALFFIKIALKLRYFCKKMQTFRALGAPPPAPVGLRRLGAPPPDPQDGPPLRISGYASGCAFERRSPLESGKKCSSVGENSFFGLHLNSGKKSVPFLAKTFIFGLHLICSTEKIVFEVYPPQC